MTLTDEPSAFPNFFANSQELEDEHEPETLAAPIEARHCNPYATEQELRAAQFDALVEQAMEQGLSFMQKLAVIAVLLFVIAIAVALGLSS